MKMAVEKMHELGLLKISEEKKNRIIGLYDLRNRVHIRLSDNNEFLADTFNLKLHNETIIVLQEVAEELYKNIVPWYGRCLNSEQK